MPKYFSSRGTHIAVGLIAVSSFAALPMAALAQVPTDATGTLAAGQLTNSAPALAPFAANLTGVTQTITTAVGAWNVTDATGSNEGYSITVAATAPVVAGGAVGTFAGGEAWMTLTPTTATATAGNPAAAGPTAGGAQALSTTAATIQNADADTGQGSWDFAADAGAVENLAVVIPGDASAGSYSSTLTYTAAPPVA
ncbi:hypothetical protein OJ997_05085 [Solirubrobacter phytolaccae]|uniref:WxL domain-containing protein n=1 Tax=Solirubrobacter phytolaccae TaxID=1404360 RepID=A0A9X3S9W1_9ACTN|nr:hypothetical protein [Solirubrobacter phytolaccae]MDA0179660.1 hypothetical protein [Solirubrobacter phytolaccae]